MTRHKLAKAQMALSAAILCFAVCSPAVLAAANARRPHVTIRILEITKDMHVSFEVRNSGAQSLFFLTSSLGGGKESAKDCSVAIDDDVRRIRFRPGHFAPSFVEIPAGETRVLERMVGLLEFQKCKRIRMSVIAAGFAENPEAVVKSDDDDAMHEYLIAKQLLYAAPSVRMKMPSGWGSSSETR